MKQLIFLFSLAVLFAACNGGGSVQGTDELESQMDSISYAVGSFFTQQFDGLEMEVNVDELGKGVRDTYTGEMMISTEESSTMMQNFQQTLMMRQGAPFTEEDPSPFNIDTLSYAIGVDFANNMKEFDIELNAAAFYQGAKDYQDDTESMIGDREDALMQELTNIITKKQEAEAAVAAEATIEEGASFISAKAAEEGVMSTPSGLHYKVLQEGTGESPVATDQVTVHYEGRLIDGTVFDSSIARGEPATFPLNGVIAGWTEGVQLMKKGAKYQFYIPHDLAYGLRGSPPNIPGGATLVFDVELLGINE